MKDSPHLALSWGNEKQPSLSNSSISRVDDGEETGNEVTNPIVPVCTAVAQSSMKETRLLIDVSLIPNNYRFGSLYEFVGEIESDVSMAMFCFVFKS